MGAVSSGARSCIGTFFICCVAVALTAALGRLGPIPLARCRELLGDEAEALTDQEIAVIRHHAETMACMVVEMYLDHCRIPE